MIDWSTIIASVITALATISSVFLGQQFFKRRSGSGYGSCDKDPVIKDTLQSRNVYKALEFLLTELDADRAYVIEFHNGNSYLSGRGQQKFSCTHEIVTEGTSRECIEMQEYKVSNYHSYISHLIDDGKFFSYNSNELDDHAFSSLLHSKGVKSILNVPIKTLNGNIIGVLGVDYVKRSIDLKKMQEKFAQEDLDLHLLKFIKAQARAIGGYLI